MEKLECYPRRRQGHFKAVKVSRSCKKKATKKNNRKIFHDLSSEGLLSIILAVFEKKDAMLSSLCLCLEIFFLTLCCYTATKANLNFKVFSSQGKFPEWLSQKKAVERYLFFYYSLNQIPRDIVCQCQIIVTLLTYGALKQEKAIQTDPIPVKEIFKITLPSYSNAAH